MRLVLLGGPGAGKGTQARLIAARLGIPHVATGELLRAAGRADTGIGRQLRGYLDKGALVPDETVVELTRERLKEPDAGRGFVLDGFPRTLAQAEQLDLMLEQQEVQLDYSVVVQVPEDELVKRLSGRRTCRQCGAMYHVGFRPPRVAGVCDVCGGELYLRSDDTEQTVRRRLELYREQATPLLDYYRRQGVLLAVDGLGSAEIVEQRIALALAGNHQSRPDRDRRARMA
ncbi:MAG: adenylate kinase [Deltaproteobacteria bacterium]|jgi:adenylate kinase|nr:adenylate kinase [Deltaproteobacteria bacterium]